MRSKVGKNLFGRKQILPFVLNLRLQILENDIANFTANDNNACIFSVFTLMGVSALWVKDLRVTTTAVTERVANSTTNTAIVVHLLIT